MILSTLGAAGVAVLLAAGTQEPERVSVPDLQDEIYRVVDAQSETERETALKALQANAGDEHEALIRELFGFLRQSTSTREAMAFAGIRQVLSIPDEHIIRALVPLFEEGDESLNAALSGVLSGFESRSPDDGADFTAYVPFLTGEPPAGLVRHMRSIDRGAASRALAAAQEPERPEEGEWVEQPPAAVPVFAQEGSIRPVTDEDLERPSANDWLTWRRTLDGQGYSPLDQITKDNVDQLRLAWSWSLGPGSQQTTPLVHDGILYIANPGEIVQALDAATGDFLWDYRRDAPAPGDSFGGPPPGRQHRNIAMYEDKVYLNTADAHIIAIDARTGEAVWDTDVGRGAGFQYSSGSIVADGKVVSGLTGCGRYRDDTCYIVGLDARSGDEVWRTSTIALPGERGGDTWGDLPVMFRAGSDSWIPGSYDPVTRTLFHGTSQAKPWARVVRGTDGDALYTNSTLALDPDTGEMKWYFQHIPGETLDMDEAFERILVDYNGRRSVFTMGKMGVLWELDAETGAFRSAHDLGYQTFANVDPETGEVTYRGGMIPELYEEIFWCPSTAGFKSWRAMSYSPETEAFVIPINLNCETAVFGPMERVEGRGGTGPVRRTNHFHPDSPGHLGELLSMSIGTGEVLWRQRFKTPINSAALTTGGGLAFAGTWDRYIYAFDVTDGEILWSSRLPTSIQGFPISYAVDGRQYLAVPVGTGGGSWGGMIPAELMPEEERPVGGNGLFVFALPQE